MKNAIWFDILKVTFLSPDIFYFIWFILFFIFRTRESPKKLLIETGLIDPFWLSVSHAIQSVQSVTCLTNSGHFCVITSLSEGAAKDPAQRSGRPKKPGHI